MESETATNVHAPPHILKAKGWMIGLTLMIGVVVTSVVLTVALIAIVPTQPTIASVVASGVGTLFVFVLYSYLTNKSVSSIDIPDFSVKAVGIGVAVGGTLTIVQTGLTILFVSQGIGTALGPLGKMIQVRGIGFLLALSIINLVVIAPAEELLYRNGIQKLLYRSHTTAFAVIGASIIFTLPHTLSFLTLETSAMVTGFIEIFVNGAIYGSVYAYWQRVDVTIIAHGFYNCAVFIFAYLGVFGALL